MSDELFKAQINSLIRDEIQEIINDYVDLEEETKKKWSWICP
jgi:hypothetical protein